MIKNKMKVMIKAFSKKYPMLLISSIIAVLIIIGYILTNDSPELFKYGEEIFYVLFNLSLAIIANTIFIIFQIFVPSYKNQQRIDEYVLLNLKDISLKMYKFFHGLSKELRGKVEFDKEDFKKIYKITMLGEIDMYNLDQNSSKIKLNEWIIKRTRIVEKIICDIKIVLSFNIENEILDILNKILRSDLHTNILGFALSNINLNVDGTDCKFYEEYYGYMKELDKIIEKKNI